MAVRAEPSVCSLQGNRGIVDHDRARLQLPFHAQNGGPAGFLKAPLLRAASREDGNVQGRGQTRLDMGTTASQPGRGYPRGGRTPLAPQRNLARFRPAKRQFSRGFRLAAGGGSMRSEREPGLGLVRGGGGGREKRSMEVPLRRESPRREPDTTTNPPSSPAPPLPPAPVKQRDEKKTALSKVRGAGLRVAGRGVGARNRRARCGVRLRALWCCGTAARRGERYVPCCRIGKPAPRMSP